MSVCYTHSVNWLNLSNKYLKLAATENPLSSLKIYGKAVWVIFFLTINLAIYIYNHIPKSEFKIENKS